MGRVWRSFEVHARKKLDCCEGTAVRNMDVKGILVRVQKEENFREILHLFREYVNNHEQNVGSNMHGKDHSGEISDGNEERIGNWRKGDSYIVAKNLAELCCSVLWKVEPATDESGYLAE